MQHALGQRRFAVLAPQSVYRLEKLRPIDELVRLITTPRHIVSVETDPELQVCVCVVILLRVYAAAAVVVTRGRGGVCLCKKYAFPGRDRVPTHSRKRQTSIFSSLLFSSVSVFVACGFSFLVSVATCMFMHDNATAH